MNNNNFMLALFAIVTIWSLNYICGMPAPKQAEVPIVTPAVSTTQQSNNESEPIKEDDSESLQHLGTFLVTAYCPCYECSEGWSNETSTGVKAKEGRTIAVDPKVIPYGSEVIIDGHTYVAEDCGGLIKGNRLDIYFDTHRETNTFGKQYLDVYVKEAV